MEGAKEREGRRNGGRERRTESNGGAERTPIKNKAVVKQKKKKTEIAPSNRGRDGEHVRAQTSSLTFTPASRTASDDMSGVSLVMCQ